MPLTSSLPGIICPFLAVYSWLGSARVRTVRHGDSPRWRRTCNWTERERERANISKSLENCLFFVVSLVLTKPRQTPRARREHLERTLRKREHSEREREREHHGGTRPELMNVRSARVLRVWPERSLLSGSDFSISILLLLCLAKQSQDRMDSSGMSAGHWVESSNGPKRSQS